MGRGSHTFDWVIVTTATLLLSLGLITLLSIDQTFFRQQLIIGVLGLVLYIIFSKIEFSTYYYLDWYIYGTLLVFLALTVLGPEVRGATRWLEIGSFRLQPSELVKPFFLVSSASLLSRYPPLNLKRIGLHIVLMALPFYLVFRQPDLGNALIYLVSWLTMVLLSGIPLITIVLGGIMAGIIMPLSSYFIKDYQKQRILTFLDPLLDPQGAGYNAIQAMIAVGSGRILGSGFGRGTQSLLQFLPERHTDFIFASFTEEFGFVGAVVLISIFYVLLWQLLKQAYKMRQHLVIHLYIVGFFTLMLGHFVINVGMNMGLLPITGITLPFVSYGGSSLLAIFIGLGIFEAARASK